MICKLALEDGTVFTGHSTGAPGTVTGEVVFNTAMAGYQEVLTDPSYCGQIVAMTSSMIGNYGVNDTDQESRRTFLSGFVVREMVKQHSNWRATGGLPAYLEENGVVAVTGVDTRALTRRLRVLGSLRGALSTEISDDRELIGLARATPSMAGHKLADRVTRDEPCGWDERLPGNGDATARKTAAELHVAVIDTGAKSNILRHLVSRGCRTRIVPCTAPAEAILESKPDGVLVCNGPGDPEPVVDTIAALRSIIGRVPLFGICLGHQLISLALGAKTHKLKFGHHGVNHPVLNIATGRVEITSQNHGFAVTEESLPGAGAVVTHRSLNDRSVEGIAHASDPIFAVQYHPEAAPGPHDSTYLFDGFIEMMQSGQVPQSIVPG